ncbi:MAG: excinuclease ABC subunit UvrC [Coxiellaceae bacterium]|jgi:excinuclease ABC subunit C|nr:excinuclease ABC subunit UvrC [Coxiellaceae bacterium]
MLVNPKQFLQSLPNKPGVYQMYDDKGIILYVGKAKNLKKRVSSYFRRPVDLKTDIFMSQVKNIEVMITPSENEALLLESNLIKIKKPHYNILFKDDKSFPYLVLSEHDFPRLEIYRGTINKSHGKYFGPFPDAKAIRFVFNMLQKIFRLRVCKDSFMRNRSRSCMLYQIRLCSAPCVDYIDKNIYALQVKLVEEFLHNKSNYVVQELTKLMDEAAAKLVYEQAANYRDQITSIRRVQAEQAITKAWGNYDVIAIVAKEKVVGINVLFIRNGLVIGNRNYFPRSHDLTESLEDILSAFIMHYYFQDQITGTLPDKILLNIKLPNRLNITKIFCERFHRKVTISNCIKGAQKQLIVMAEANALNAVKIHNGAPLNYKEYLLDFKKTLELSVLPRRIECFDVSHTMGEATVASCVVFDENGPAKSKYRSFNIRMSLAHDDYSALHEVLLRRYCDLRDLPDVIMIDGGVGQLGVALQVLKGLKIEDVVLLAIAKGEGRKPGLEKIYLYGREEPLILAPNNLSLHLMQQIRDEAHRFAISGHRKRMRRQRYKSELESVLGIGRSKRILLLKYFGGIEELRSAGIIDLMKIEGIGHTLAKRIYEHLHE